ncbi:MAG: hypothetical protein BMS9Abin37_1911 [Acidobacteriota bacterium]|nr:MAG: hypothetical protein BMS9Abin37_1911 [Acidobacteriota bacterium]
MDGLKRRTDIVILAYLILVGALVIINGAFHSTLPSWKILALVHLGAAAVVYTLRFLPERLPALAQFFRDWYPAIAFPVFYKEVELLAGAFGNWTLTESIQRLEMGLFRGHPSLYLSEHLDWVILSEYLHFCYFSYLWLFPVIGGIWYFTGKRSAFQELLFLVTVTFATSYVFYILFPVDSPFYLSEPLRDPLSGSFFHELVHALSSRGGARGGAFPSSHVSISTVILLVTLKYQPRWFYWLVPIYLGLVFATVYGRFHYALDVFAGWALAFAVVGLYWISVRKIRRVR